ncbi:hypothetical protein [Candidatus Liberibacter sp.]|uniref:hypothetical protein n=1 Tax=Candidatus Liberibacter sp. TaxID=34022 RepID=UPI0015F39488|nr:hypothetical protein [Candidatus Liberibacter sp.]MBA5724499.1 hypothetical protein [Candidatus Liberibacter sp.]
MINRDELASDRLASVEDAEYSLSEFQKTMLKLQKILIERAKIEREANEGKTLFL